MGLVFGCPLAAYGLPRATLHAVHAAALVLVPWHYCSNARRAQRPERLPARQFRSLNDEPVSSNSNEASGRTAYLRAAHVPGRLEVSGPAGDASPRPGTPPLDRPPRRRGHLSYPETYAIARAYPLAWEVLSMCFSTRRRRDAIDELYESSTPWRATHY